MCVIRDGETVSKFEINIVFAGVTRAIWCNQCLFKKVKKNFLKPFVALHCPIVRFQVLFLSNKRINCITLVL